MSSQEIGAASPSITGTKARLLAPKRLRQTVSHTPAQAARPMASPVNDVAATIAATPRLIPIDAVCAIVSLKRSAVHAKVAAGELPRPVKFGKGRRAAARWIEQEIYDCVRALAAARFDPLHEEGDM
jgi:predicted DNA-binding transcriptional regulator AlpA